jgi:serine/threonine protein kinase
MQLGTTEFKRALQAVSEGRQSLDSLLTALSSEDQVGTVECAARLGMVQELRDSGRLSDEASDKVVKTIYRSPDTGRDPAPSAPMSGSHPSNWSTWAENQPATPPLTPGCVLRDRFVLEEVIGSGGMSVVFRALDRRREEALDRQPHVAIKVLGDEFKRHPDALRALQRESRKTQRLAHHNIASVYDFDRDGPNVYMVMELLVGEPLDALLRRRGPLGLEKAEALRMLSEMGAGLSHAHGFGIVHSDFKPSNAFVTLSGETKLIDFGVSRATKPANAQGNTVLTMFDAGKLGAITVAYCSPEQMLGDADPDPRDDVYALGVVAYELLSGKHPFDGRSALDAQLKGLSVKPIEGLSDEQNAALRAALECRREQRTASVVELLQGLGIHPAPGERGLRAIPNERAPVSANQTRLRSRAPEADFRHPTAPPPVSPWRRWVLASALLLAVAGAGLYGFQQWQLRANEALEQQRHATENAERGRDAAEALIEQERVAREKADEERLAAEAARRAASARAKAEKARAAAAAASAPAVAGSGLAPELQRAIAAEEAQQDAGQAGAAVPASDASAPAPSAAPTDAGAAASEAGKRTLYRWQDESGAVRYGVEVPEQYKDNAIVVLPGD